MGSRFGDDDHDTGDGGGSDSEPLTASGLNDYLVQPLVAKLDEVVAGPLEQIIDRESQQAQALATLAGELTSTPREEIAPRPREFPWNVEIEVPASTTINDPIVTEFEPDYDATITGIEIDYPDGVQQSVAIQIRSGGGERWVPRGGTVNIVGPDPADPNDPEDSEYTSQGLSIEPNIDVSKDSPIVVQCYSTDPDENHFIGIDFMLQERTVGEA